MATPSDSVEIHFLKCRAKIGSRDVEQVTMKNGRPALRAVCTVCGTGKYRIYGMERNAAASAGSGRFIAENARAKLRLLYPDTPALTQYHTPRSPATAWGTVLPCASVLLSLTGKDGSHGNLHREDDFRFHTSVQRWTDDIP